MLKMYHKSNPHSGGVSDFWEDVWSKSSFEEALRFCNIDPLRRLFERYVAPGYRMLEGGCGQGHYVAYLQSRGVIVVGLDFAQGTLHHLKRELPNLTLCVGDVSTLPFKAESFDVYYSGGVVEHFEAGAELALSEAARVLRTDGVLLISVPYYSPLRKLLFPFKRELWKLVNNSVVDESRGSDLNFFQYAYKPKEFEKLLREAQFKVMERQGYAVLWGLYDIPFISQANNVTRQTDPSKLQVGEQILSSQAESENVSLLKRLVASEDDSVTILGFGVRFMRWISANMMMYVCKKQ